MVERFGMIDEASGYSPLYFGKVNDVEDYAIAGEQYVRLTDYEALRARLETVEAETRERIAAALDEEADLIPYAEDAMVTRSNARLVRANFSYEDAERLEVEEDAARALSQEGSDA